MSYFVSFSTSINIYFHTEIKIYAYIFFVVVQLLSYPWLFVTPWTATCQAFLSFTVSYLPESAQFKSIESVIPSNHLILSHPLLLLLSIFPSIRVFSNESALCIRWPKHWSFNVSISPSSEYSGLIAFRIDWSDLLVVQGTLKSLLQHHNPKASILQHSAFFMVQRSHLYMTTGKTVALAIWTFVSKAMPLLFNTLSRFVNSRFLCKIVLHSIGLHKKDLNDPNNDDGVITHLEPDTLEWEVKCTLGSITMNKASGGHGIPAELF